MGGKPTIDGVLLDGAFAPIPDLPCLTPEREVRSRLCEYPNAAPDHEISA
jgi:hypothetical protein